MIVSSTTHHTCLHSYDDALRHVKDRLAKLSQSAPLFVTAASEGGHDLWDVFLSSIDTAWRQHYTCNACKHFIRRYGSLAVVVDGRIHSALWDVGNVYPHGLDRAFAAMAKVVSRARIVTVFRSREHVIGSPRTGEWQHFHAQLAGCHLHRSALTTPAQAMAEKREEFGMLSRSFGDFTHDTVRTAAELLRTGQLYRSEKCQGVADWLLHLYDERAAAPRGLQDNVTWLAVADAPAGWCHVRSGMIGTLLEDIQAGLPFNEIKRRFAEKMHPLQYLRPQVAPSAGNIAQAERVVEQLRTTGALARRFARLDEIETFWRPTEQANRSNNGGVFGHLRTRETQRGATIQLPQQTMTWVKFRDTVLSEAQRLEFFTGSRQAFCAIVTAANADALPLLQWDRDDRRNPASWYLYNGGSTPRHWNLPSNDWAAVDALTLRPCHWHGHQSPKEGEGFIAVLHDARDTQHRVGGGFFPESLRAEYHAVRRTMEAYAKSASIEGRDSATACGVMLTNQGAFPDVRFRVTTSSGSVSVYRLDRWD